MTYRARCSALPPPPSLAYTYSPCSPPSSPLHSNVQHGRVFPFVSICGVRTGPNSTRSLVLHLYSPALVGSTSHSNMGCSLAVRCEARGSPCGTNHYESDLGVPFGVGSFVARTSEYDENKTAGAYIIQREVADFGSRRVRTFPDEERIIILTKSKNPPAHTKGSFHQNWGGSTSE